MRRRRRGPEIIGTCPCCNEPIYAAEDHYEFPGGEMCCDNCMIEFVRENFYRHGCVDNWGNLQ